MHIYIYTYIFVFKGLRAPEHRAGRFHPDHKKTPPSQEERSQTRRTASFQKLNLEKWAHILGDLNFQRTCWTE